MEVSYYSKLLQGVISNSWIITEGIITFLALISIPIILYWPRMEATVKILAWAIPVGVLGLLILINVIVVPHTIYSEQQKTIKGINDRVTTINNQLQEVTAQRDLYKAQIDVLNSQIQSASKQGFATPDQLIGKDLSDLTIRITDLTRESDVITDRTFTNCRIWGPAVLGADATDAFYSSIFNYGNATPDSMLITTTNDIVLGCIGLKNCVFRSCQFYRLSFIGSAKQMEDMKSQIKWNP